MTLINIDPVGTTTLLCTSSTLDDTVGDDDLKSTTYAGLTTTVTSGGISSPHVNIRMANNYIDSLSDTQLVQMVQMLDEKENEFVKLGNMEVQISGPQQGNIELKALGEVQPTKQPGEQPKVYQKTNKI